MSDVVERLRRLFVDAGDVIEAAVDQYHRDALWEAADEIERLRPPAEGAGPVAYAVMADGYVLAANPNAALLTAERERLVRSYPGKVFAPGLVPLYVGTPPAPDGACPFCGRDKDYAYRDADAEVRRLRDLRAHDALKIDGLERTVRKRLRAVADEIEAFLDPADPPPSRPRLRQWRHALLLTALPSSATDGEAP